MGYAWFCRVCNFPQESVDEPCPTCGRRCGEPALEAPQEKPTDLFYRLHALAAHEHDDHSIGDEAAEEIERLRGALNIDRTGLARGLSRVRQIARGFGWIPQGAWGCYPEDQQTEETLRREVGDLLDQVGAAALTALRASGDLVTGVLRDDSRRALEDHDE